MLLLLVLLLPGYWILCQKQFRAATLMSRAFYADTFTPNPLAPQSKVTQSFTSKMNPNVRSSKTANRVNNETWATKLQTRNSTRKDKLWTSAVCFLKASTELDGCSTVSDHFRGRITFCFQLSVQDSTSKTWSEDPWDRLVIEEWSSS